MTLPHLFASPVASCRDFLCNTGFGLDTLTLTPFALVLDPLA